MGSDNLCPFERGKFWYHVLHGVLNELEHFILHKLDQRLGLHSYLYGSIGTAILEHTDFISRVLDRDS